MSQSCSFMATAEPTVNPQHRAADTRLLVNFLPVLLSLSRSVQLQHYAYSDTHLVHAGLFWCFSP